MFALRIALEVTAILLLLAGYWNEDKVIAFERRLWARLRGARPAEEARTHSATYYASREEEHRVLAQKARIARNAEMARKQAAARRAAEEPRRAA